MDNNYNEEEIIEDIQIEEDEYEDENNKNSNINNTNNEDNTEEDLMYEDEYESVKDEILKSMSIASSYRESLSINKMKQKNKSKLNKLSLLLTQKFLNILISILSCRIKKDFKIFMTNMKSLIMFKFNMINLSNKNKIKNKKPTFNKNSTANKYKINNNRIKSAKQSSITNTISNNNFYKVPKYYLESLKKQEERKIKKEMIKKHHEDLKKKKIKEEKKKEKETKTSTEIEYEKYQYQKKLEKYNEQERKKYQEDLIRKEVYADNIYKFIKKKKFFKNLKFNLEIRKVVTIFLTNINNKMIKINGIRTMKKVSKYLEEKRLKKEKLDNLNADMFYKNKLKQKIFLFILKYKKISINEEHKKISQFNIYQKRNYFKLFKKGINYEFLECKEKKDKIINKHMYYIKRQMFYILIYFIKEKKDEKIKEELMSKLRNKAQELLKQYE